MLSVIPDISVPSMNESEMLNLHRRIVRSTLLADYPEVECCPLVSGPIIPSEGLHVRPLYSDEIIQTHL